MISDIAPDFRLLDVWDLPVEGDRDDFAPALEMIASLDPTAMESVTARALFALRRHIGRWTGWDDTTRKRSIPGCAETTLRTRLPDRLRGTATSPAVGVALRRAGANLVPLYRTDDEWAAELSNDTVHAVVHIAWVAQGEGRFRAQLAVYVKPRGRLGEMYMLLIQPFRRLVVYPALMRHLGRRWEAPARIR